MSPYTFYEQPVQNLGMPLTLGASTSRRPADGRYGENPNRLYQHHQFQSGDEAITRKYPRTLLGKLAFC